jgi:hypothetical protein
MPALPHKILFVALLLLSLGLKWNGTTVLSEHSDEVLAQAKSKLSAEGFSVEARMAGKNKLIVRKGSCVVTIRLVDAHAIALSHYKSKMPASATLRYAWRGHWLDSRPRFWPLIDYYAKREVVRQGFAASRLPVWIAGFADNCTVMPSAAFSTIGLSMVPASAPNAPNLEPQLPVKPQ